MPGGVSGRVGGIKTADMKTAMDAYPKRVIFVGFDAGLDILDRFEIAGGRSAAPPAGRMGGLRVVSTWIFSTWAMTIS